MSTSGLLDPHDRADHIGKTLPDRLIGDSIIGAHQFQRLSLHRRVGSLINLFGLLAGERAWALLGNLGASKKQAIGTLKILQRSKRRLELTRLVPRSYFWTC